MRRENRADLIDLNRRRWRHEQSRQRSVIAMQLPEQKQIAVMRADRRKQEPFFDADVAQKTTAKRGVILLVEREHSVEALVVARQQLVDTATHLRVMTSERTSPTNVTAQAASATKTNTRGTHSRNCVSLASASRYVQTVYMPSGNTAPQ